MVPSFGLPDMFARRASVSAPLSACVMPNVSLAMCSNISGASVRSLDHPWRLWVATAMTPANSERFGSNFSSLALAIRRAIIGFIAHVSLTRITPSNPPPETRP